MYGYMPSYQQLIEPTKTITLFDHLASDFEGLQFNKSNLHQQSANTRIRYGLCLVRNDSFSQDFMKFGL